MQTKMAQRPRIVLKLGCSKNKLRDGDDQGHSRVRRLHPLAPAAAQGDCRHARLVQPGAQGPGQGRARLLQLGRGYRDDGGRGRPRCPHRARPRECRRPAACLDHLPVPRPAAFGHRRRGAEPGRGRVGDRCRRHPARGHVGADRGAGERHRDAGGRLREARRQGRESVRDVERRWRRRRCGGGGQPGRQAAGQGHAHGRFRRPLPLRRQPVRLPVGGALDPRCGLHADRAAGDQAVPGGRQGVAQGRHALLHAGDTRARGHIGRQGGGHRRQGDLRSPARQSRRHGCRASADARRSPRWRRPSPATRSWSSASARAPTRCCSR